MKRAIVLFAFMSLATASWAAVEIGKPAPEFEAKDINGKTVKLSDFQGKIVVLESYNIECPFCANHFKTGAMQELQKEITSKGGVWLMVNSVNPKHPNYRTPEQSRAEWTAQKMNATAWLDDSSGKIGQAYGMRTTPHMFVIDQKGVLVYNGAIDDQATPNHDPRKARNYVKEAFAKTLAGEKVELAETKPYGCSVKYAN